MKVGGDAVRDQSKIRIMIWNSMLSADLNYRYFSTLTGRFQSHDQWAKIFIAIFSSTVVSGWAIWGQPELNWIWHVVSGLAAILAIALPIWNPANSMKIASKLAGSWFSILKDYEVLWTEVDEIDERGARDKLKKIVDEEKRLSEVDTLLKVNRKISSDSEKAVRQARGLNSEE